MPTKAIDKPKPKPRKPVKARLEPVPPSLWDVQRLVGAATSWAIARREVIGIGQYLGAGPLGGLMLKITVLVQSREPASAGNWVVTSFDVYFELAGERDPRPALWVRQKLSANLALAKRRAAQRAASGPGKAGGP